MPNCTLIMQTNVNGRLNGIVQFSRYIYYSIKCTWLRV